MLTHWNADLRLRAASVEQMAPPRTPSTPGVDKIIDNYIRAVGGRNAIMKVRTRVFKASFVLNDLTVGTLTVYAKAPNKRIAIVTDSDDHVVTEYGFDGVDGWNQDTETGFYNVSGKLLASMRRDADFYREINLKTLYPKMTLKGKEKVGDREFYVIEAIPEDGAAETMYFDVLTGLLGRRDEEVELPQGTAQLKMYFDDYKTVDGVKLPFTITRLGPNGRTLTRLAEVKQNIEIPDTQFNRLRP